MPDLELHDYVLDRMVLAVELVRERLLRATAALERAGVPYAVIGGNAVAAGVARVDPTAVRNTSDVDLLLERSDLPAATAALEGVGFVRRQAAGIDMFLDGAGAKFREAVHVNFANEKVRPEDPAAAPDLAEIEKLPEFRVVSLEAIVRMKLTSFRRKDQVHLLDLLGVGLIDTAWCNRYSEELSSRLRMLIETRDDEFGTHPLPAE
ncbi:MAG: hypothetical protein ACKV0T_24215 [Planctomycetales bacterium]